MTIPDQTKCQNINTGKLSIKLVMDIGYAAKKLKVELNSRGISNGVILANFQEFISIVYNRNVYNFRYTAKLQLKFQEKLLYINNFIFFLKKG